MITNLEWNDGPIVNADFSGLDLDHVRFDGCDLTDVTFANSKLRSCSFRNATLTRVSFCDAEHLSSDFRSAKIHSGDYRYALFVAGTFRDSELDYCDFYRAVFERGTVFEDARLEWCSLDSTDLRGSTIRLNNLSTLLPHEDLGQLRLIHQLREGVVPNDVNLQVEEDFEQRSDVAAKTYRHLAGCWSAAGFYRDEGSAYQRAKDDLELKRSAHLVRAAPTATKRTKAALDTIGLVLAKLSCGYGERLGYIAWWILALALVPAVVLLLTAGLVEAHGGPAPGALDCIRYSLGNMVTTPPSDLAPANARIDFLLVFQTLIAIPMLGLFGFVLGNRIRRS
jgi:uncharacterized protein YjbI with pentapeptide repeats